MEDFSRGPVAQGLPGPEPAVEPEVVFHTLWAFGTLAWAFGYTCSCSTVRCSRSTKMLSEYRPFRSMLTLTRGL